MKDLAQLDIKDLLRNKNIAAVIAILALTLFFLYIAYSDYDRNLTQVNREIRRLEEAEAQSIAWEEASRRYIELSEGLLDNAPFVFKRQVEQEAKEAGINIVSLRTPPRQKESFYEIGTIEVSLLSSYKELIDFISRIESQNIFIESLSLREEDGRIGGDLKLKTILIAK